jgi:hypothetical protein
MPVARGPSVNLRSALVVGLSGLIAAVLLGVVVVAVAGRSDNVQLRLGDERFGNLSSVRSARTIARDGPLLFSDVAGGSRDIYVQHLGDDPATGWRVFDARPIGEPRSCVLVWDDDDRVFNDNGRCSQAHTVPADGSGLRQYAVTIEAGRLVIDLNVDPATTTTSQES